MSNQDYATFLAKKRLEVPAHPAPNAGPPVFIYGLLDPETVECRYIGKSIRPRERLTNHMNETSSCHRTHWLQSLRARGLRPLLVIFERIEGAVPWQHSERYWIARGRRLGWPLTNGTDGGDGVPGLSAESRAKVSAAWLGRRHRPETIEKLRAARATQTISPETRVKMSAAHRGRVITWGARISDAVRKIAPEDVARIRARLLVGERVGELAAEFGVHRTTVSKIKKGRYP